MADLIKLVCVTVCVRESVCVAYIRLADIAASNHTTVTEGWVSLGLYQYYYSKWYLLSVGFLVVPFVRKSLLFKKVYSIIYEKTKSRTGN